MVFKKSFDKVHKSLKTSKLRWKFVISSTGIRILQVKKEISGHYYSANPYNPTVTYNCKYVY